VRWHDTHGACIALTNASYGAPTFYNHGTAAFFLFVLLWTCVVIVNLPWYTTMGRAALDMGDAIVAHKEITFERLRYFRDVFLLYGMAGFVLCGGAGMAYVLFSKQWRAASPLFVIAPTLHYLFNPQVSSDHPWMLRRYAFSVFPVLILYTTFLLSEWYPRLTLKKRSMVLALALLLIGGNMPAFMRYATFKEFAGLRQQVMQLGERFDEHDLVMMDCGVSADCWTSADGPLRFLAGKNAMVLLRFPGMEYLDTGKFEHLYLITPNEVAAFYTQQSDFKSRLKYVDDYTISSTRRTLPNNTYPTSLPQTERVIVRGKIFEIEQ